MLAVHRENLKLVVISFMVADCWKHGPVASMFATTLISGSFP